jgi:hypothetical protein
MSGKGFLGFERVFIILGYSFPAREAMMSARHLALFLFMIALLSRSSIAQGIVDCIEQKKIYIPKVSGQVFDFTGVPVPEVDVQLVRVGRVIDQTKTDSEGKFSFKTPPGIYTLRAAAQGFEVTNAQIEVGKDLSSLFHSNSLRVILALEGLNCPWITTSNREFKELKKKNATQK